MKSMLASTLVALCATRPIPAADSITQGGLRLAAPAGGQEAGQDLPLKHTDVEAEISGFLTRVKVTQVFTNPYDAPIEAIYVFPLPPNAAVGDMQIRIGERVVRGVIKKRDEARDLYERAKRAGKTAALLDQERPNIFSQAVANILPGSEIRVEITYDEVLPYERGAYEFVFPMVVGPRYIPGEAVGKNGGGWSPDTDRVPDASRITPPVLKPGERNGHDIGVRVRLNAGMPVRNVASPTHEIEKKGGKDERDVEIALAAHDAIPNKDFVLRYEVAADAPRFGVLAHRAERDGTFLLMFQPPDTPSPETVMPKEMVFVVDCSGSMDGEPLTLVKQAMRYALEHLNTNDTFQIVQFSDTASPLAPAPLPATPENVRSALSYINGLNGRGGTGMLSGIKAGLDGEPADGRLRVVCFMTDGYIGNEREVLAAIGQRLGPSTRLFSFGVGLSVNRFLLDAMAEAGRGAVQYVTLKEKPENQVRRFYERVRNPVMTDVRVDWAGLQVHDLMPGRPKDLFAGQPLFLVGRYDQAGTDTIRVHGKVNGADTAFDVPVQLPDREAGHASLPALWARSRIKELSSALYEGEHGQTVKEITDLAIAFSLMSDYTSFVAIEEKVVNEGGEPRTIQVPVEMPMGVQHETVFGDASGPLAMAATAAMSPSRARIPLGGFFAVRERASPAVYAQSAEADSAGVEAPAFELAWTRETDARREVLRILASGEVWLDQQSPQSGKILGHLQVTRLTPRQREELWLLLVAARDEKKPAAAHALKGELALRLPDGDGWSIALSPEAERCAPCDALVQWLAQWIPAGP